MNDSNGYVETEQYTVEKVSERAKNIFDYKDKNTRTSIFIKSKTTVAGSVGILA